MGTTPAWPPRPLLSALWSVRPPGPAHAETIWSTCSITQTSQTMQGNNVLTGNVIILTHDRPIHKTTGVPGPAQGAGLGLSPEPGGSRCCWGEGQLPLAAWSLAGSLNYLSKKEKKYFFKKNESQSIVVSMPCLNSPIAKAPLQTKEFCKPFALFRRETRLSPGACVFICPSWQSRPCCGLDPSLFSDLRSSTVQR